MRERLARRRRDDRGAVLAFVAVAASAIVASAAFAVDLGAQRVVRSDMQALADVVALDLGRTIDQSRTASQLNTLWNATAASDSVGQAYESAKRNNTTVGARPSTRPGSAWACVPGACLHAVPGWLDTVLGTWTPFDDAGHQSAVPNAVQVETRGVIGFHFVPGTGGADRTAIAVNKTICAASDASCLTHPNSSVTACVNLGSWLARENLPGSSLSADMTATLGPLGAQLQAVLNLPSAGSLTALGYGGLADGHVTIGDIAAIPALNIGSASQLAGAQIKALDLINALATIMSNKPGDPTASTEVTILNAVAAKLQGTLFAGVLVNVGQLVGASATASQSLQTNVNLFDLVTSELLLVGGQHFVDAPTSLTIPGLTTLKVDANVISPAEQICGPVGTTGHTAQIHVGIQGTSNDSDIPSTVNAASPQLGGALSLLYSVVGQLGSLSPATVTLTPSVTPVSATVELASANATISSIGCHSGTTIDPDTVGTAVDAQAATVTLDVPIRLNGTVTVSAAVVNSILGVLGLGSTKSVKLDVSVTAEVKASTTNTGTASSLILNYPPNDKTAVSTNGAGLGISGLTTTTTGPAISITLDSADTSGVTGTLLNQITNALSGAIQSTVQSTVNALVTQVANPVITNLNGLLATNPSDPNSLTSLLGLNVAGADLTLPSRPECQSVILAGP